MRRSKKILILILFSILLPSFPNGSAIPSLSLEVDKQVYEYGDFLSLTLQVSELTGDPVILHITDSSGKTSSPIPIHISELNSTITAPIPFYKTSYAPGTYKIEAEYYGAKTTASFELVDSGKIAIPFQYKELVKSWFQEIPTNDDYARLIRELMNFNIIEVPNYHIQNTVRITHWLLNDAKWWSNDSISDDEFGHALQYSLQKGFISV